MSYIIFCTLVFAGAYSLTLMYTSVFYHRGLTHKAVRLRSWTHKVVVKTGSWITGLDPKTWTCMHRLHHVHADTKRDPHSPLHGGFFTLLLVQLRSYGKTMKGLLQNRPYYSSIVADLKFPVSWLHRKGLWFLPLLLHLGIACGLSILFGGVAIGLCYWLGMMSHPIQGWLVNSFGHRFGYRNFKTADNSRNNLFVGWFVMGEGFQNNHHYRPSSPKFSFRWWELDLGYWLCLLARFLYLIDFPRPSYARNRCSPERDWAL